MSQVNTESYGAGCAQFQQSELVHQINESWQNKFDALVQESSMKEKAFLSEREYLMLEIQNMSKQIEAQNEVIRLSREAFQAINESSADALPSEGKDLKENIQTLCEEKGSQTTLVCQRKDDLQITLEQERVLTVKSSESSTEALLSEGAYLKEKIQSLSEEVETQCKLVKSWEVKYNTLEQEKVLAEKNSESSKEAFLTERKDFLEKLKKQATKMGQLTVKCEYLEIAKRSNEAGISKMKTQILTLEDVCLRQKKKNLGLFGRRMADRKTELDKMIAKVPDREPIVQTSFIDLHLTFAPSGRQVDEQS